MVEMFPDWGAACASLEAVVPAALPLPARLPVVSAGANEHARDEQRERRPRLLLLDDGSSSGPSLDGPLTCELDEEEQSA